MPENKPDKLAESLLIQTSDSIQNLYRLTTQIDERLKLMKERYDEINKRIESIADSYEGLIERLIILENKNHTSIIKDMEMAEEEISSLGSELHDVDKRLEKLENDKNKNDNKWNQIISFIIQLMILVVGSWILLKLNLYPPTK